MRKLILCVAVLALCGCSVKTNACPNCMTSSLVRTEQPQLAKQEQKAQQDKSFTVKAGGTLQIVTSQPENFMLIAKNGETLVTIHPDGTIEYGKDYSPDKAAKIFWEALGRNLPCKTQPKP